MIVLLAHGSEKSQTFTVNLKRFKIPFQVNVITGTVSCKKYDEYVIDEQYNKVISTLIS